MISTKFESFIDISYEDLNAIALSIIKLDYEYYQCIDEDINTVTDLVVSVLLERNSDLGQGLALFCNMNLIGYACFFDLKERLTRSMVSTRCLTNHFMKDRQRMVRFRENCMVFSKSVAPFNESSFYLNKIAVMERYHGKGFGKDIFEKYLAIASSQNLPACFHVRQDNIEAIQFYNKQGFYVEESKYLYQVVKSRN